MTDMKKLNLNSLDFVSGGRPKNIVKNIKEIVTEYEPTIVETAEPIAKAYANLPIIRKGINWFTDKESLRRPAGIKIYNKDGSLSE